jgi:hypothetical protein
MKQSLKGAGKLSRKLLTILVLSGMTTLGYAVDNSIYIDQAGSNAVINITQDGGTNIVKGLTSNRADAAMINADGTNIDIKQVGSGNTVSLGITATQGSGGKSVDLNYSTQAVGSAARADGSSAVININADDQTATSNIKVGAVQTGNNSRLGVDITGNDSSLSVTTKGAGDEVQSKMRGDGNITNVTFSGTVGGNLANIDQGGTGLNTVGINASSSDNTIGIIQSSGSDNSVTIGGYASGSAMSGNGNTIQVVQDGTSNKANLGITGASNTVNINQGGTAQDSNIKLSGASNTINITQGPAGTTSMLPALSIR